MKEIERKILDIDVRGLEARLKKLKPAPRKIFEGLVSVRYFDFSDGRIAHAKDLLRVRVIHPKGKKPYTEVVYKVYGGIQKGCKIFEEIETTLPGDQSVMFIKFFGALGLKQKVFYEKKRTLFKQGNVAFEIDEHPRIPAFLEIEASSPAAIEKCVRLLGLSNHEQTAETISELLRRKYPKIKLNGLTF